MDLPVKNDSLSIPCIHNVYLTAEIDSSSYDLKLAISVDDLFVAI